MTDYKETRKKANRYFFAKVAFNSFLVILGAVLISLFLRQMQKQAALQNQRENSEQALNEAIAVLQANENSTEDLTGIFHTNNQEMLEDLLQLLSSGLFDHLTEADSASRSEVFADMMNRSGVDFLFILSKDGRSIISPYEDFAYVDLVDYGLLTEENLEILTAGTRKPDGSVTPALENNEYGYYYFYSVSTDPEVNEYFVVLGADAGMLDLQLSTLNDLSAVLSRAAVTNGGFMFAVDKTNDSFLYYENGDEVLTGTDILHAGLTEDVLQDGYAGIQTINGERYYCVSRTFGTTTVICAAAETEQIYSGDRYVLSWSVSIFVLVMIMCLAYAVIVRNDFVRNAVETEKQYFQRKNGNPLIFDRSIFKKIFPLMITGVLLIFGISYYTQTLLEISETVDASIIALDEISDRYDETVKNRGIISNYYNNRYLSKAKLIAYLINEDSSVLNEETDRYHTYYDEKGDRKVILDDEGNPLRSVSSSARLQELCDNNGIDSIYIFNQDGRTIATNTPFWYFTISHSPEDQSYAFLDVLDGKTESCIQEAMVNDLGEYNQYIGTAFTYHTARDENGDTEYISRYAYENALKNDDDSVTEHQSLLQIGLDSRMTDRLMASTDTADVLRSDLLADGFIVLFDDSPEHKCVYSPYEESIGRTASDLGVSEKAFNGIDYYGFIHVNGVTYFQYFKYNEGYFVGSAIPRYNMFQSRMKIALITSITSLLLILILSATVTMTTEEEETLYKTMSDNAENSALDSTIFNIILPSGHQTSTVKAAARWDSHRIPWNQRSPEQKLLVLISLAGGIVLLYLIVVVLGVNRFFSEGSIVHYIISGNWDKNMNIFALSACVLVLMFTSLVIILIRIPVQIVSTMLGSRGETIAHLLLSVLKYGGTIFAIFFCLYLLGLDSGSLLASAGVLSLVIGLGAQSLIKDILAGIFIVFEGEFRVGDIVTISGFRGTVMDIGLRTTKIMAGSGNIKIFNNSDISGVLNMTKETSIAWITIDIEYGQDIDYVEAVLNRDLPALKEKNTKILDGPSYVGVTELGASGVTIGIMAKCSEKDVRGVNRYLNKEVLQIFYKNGINVPFPNITISQIDTSERKTIDDFRKEEEAEGEDNE